jgi:plastocyanin
MKKILLITLLILLYLNGFSASFIVSNSGFTFSPSTITITQNDDVTFSLASIHDAVEVSQATWNANGISPIIGFTVPFGGGTVSGSQLAVGTHYYICQNHGSSGMKGTIIVQSVSAVPETKIQDNIQIYPNPVKDNITIQFEPSESKAVEIRLFDIQGKMVNVLLPKTEVSGLFLRSFQLDNSTNPGVYLIKINIGESTVIRKVVII